ncbi:penicillin-binding protein 1C [Salinarimonas sp. NSM]|uniref:penicillin-binding protein 1C n=1 Tax=Salinarimonas sp. NSM TaxID=3458003 RepID=UPI004035A76C
MRSLLRRRGLRLVAGALAVALIVTGLAGAASVVGYRHFAASLGPLDLAPAQARSVLVLDRGGALLRPYATPEGRWRLPVGVADVDPTYLAMLLAYEDARFRAHGGVDVRALARAAGQLLANGRIVSGGSTLTMQVARLVEPRAERSLAAKLRQIVRAGEIEAAMGKDEILALYLSLAPYGGNLEGVRAASLAYFGREPKRLSHAEAALLVALPQSPETRRPDRYPEVARAARDRVLDRALARGVITAREREAAARQPVPTARIAFPMLAAHAADAARAERADADVHRLAIDGALQAGLEQLVARRLARLGPDLSAAILVVDNASGEVLAHVGSVGYLDRARRGAIDMTRAVRSPGSALKPFIYALAFETGLAHPETILEDRPVRYGVYAPENFDLGYQGAVTARRALQESLNVPAVALLSELGPARFVARLRQAGARVVVPRETAPGLAVGLGGLGITLEDVARLYSGLARGGSVPTLATRADAPPVPGGLAPSVADPVAAWYVFDVLRGAPAPESALGGRIAYKTGTSYGFRDAWAVGFDRGLTIAVWVGRADGGATPGLTGRNAAAPLLFDAFARTGREPQPLAVPPHALLVGTADLPPPLRHIRRDRPKTIAATAVARLAIAFPPDGARVDLGLVDAAGGAREPRLALKAQGGALPLTWLVDGVPVGAASLRREADWRPDGAGFARITVIDAAGETDTVSVRLE